ncbi:MAG TPA: hypothetical protein VEQ60_15175 [Longimicrobium sp.]|nr:hypothetical protein [Longimicrobium sp.]
MTTLLLQYAAILCYLLFGIMAIRVHHAAASAPHPYRVAWLLTGAAFTVHATSMAVQVVFGTVAIVRGAQSTVWDSYMVWSPVFNHSRTGMLLGFCGVLGFFMLRRATTLATRFYRGAVAVLASGLLLGALVGWHEKRLQELAHYSAVAVWDVLELVVLLALLLVGVATTRIDRSLWLALSLYAFSLALNVLWFAAFSRVNIPGVWTPRPWEVHLYRTLITAGMVMVAVHRYRLARRGTSVPALMETSSARVGLAG